LLDAEGIEYRYREYTEEPLTRAELESVFEKLGLTPRDLLRKNDKAAKELALTGEESDAQLLGLMAKHPTLLQRPIGVRGRKAAVGRPVENLLEIV